VVGRLRTFCHISEYDEAGYRQLHRLIAASDPLVLWAPSSQFLSDRSVSRVSPDDFLHFIEKGMVQVVAREPWLDSRSFRDNHGWPGARWNPRIDDALRRMLRDDEREPDLQRRRVAAAPDENGPDRARQMIKETPEAATEIVEALSDKRREVEIPPGTLATAVRKADDPFGRAEVVLRDAYNHADAIGLTQAETAILLGSGDSVFSQRVAAIFTEEMANYRGQAKGLLADGSTTVTAAQLSSQLVDLLALLETIGPPTDLRSFMKGKGHQELVEWSRKVIKLLVSAHPTKLKEQLVEQLKVDLKDAAFPHPPLDERVVDTASLALAAKGVLEGSEMLVLFGLAFEVYPMLKRGLRARGLADPGFTGPQWPFRYLWGTSARRSRHTQLLDLLEMGRSED
jgi:hypothetical protein